MKGRGLWVLITAMLVLPVSVTQAEDPPVLTETQTLKAENLRLKFALLQQQQQQLQEAAQKLEAERVTLESEFRVTLRALPTQTFNWQTLRFDGTRTADAKPVNTPPTGASAQPSAEKPPRSQP